ncbi:MAG: hypothetical protein KDA16_11210, partial [Phycisphaerales bacterium]|nr:hypothetical protein [Phycisphaerales bacterium]
PSASSMDGYESPLSGRYASREMQSVWSARRKFGTWRKIWLAVAEAQHETGLPVSKEQVEELRANLDITDADMAAAAEYERKLRHDVMAHVHAWGDRCPKAKGIIHLGMTSQDINDNCELLLIHEAMGIIEKKVDRLIVALGGFAEKWKSTPTLGFTHYQPAQPTTVGRRAAQWAFDVAESWNVYGNSMLRGLRGATGTQASFLNLFDGDALRLQEFEVRAILKLLPSSDLEYWEILESRLREQQHSSRSQSMQKGMSSDESMATQLAEFLRLQTFTLSGQTYPRVVDARVVSELGCIASVLHKIATDIRLLSNRKEIEEPFERDQIGSSAMPYKRNPMRCERVCALSRFVWNLVGNAYDTAATQWLERTLDDSANRRMVLPEAFLALDGCLDIMINVAGGLIVNEAMVKKNLMAELPFMVTEAVMMEAVKKGGDRQELHEVIRRHSMEAGRRVKQEGAENDLIERLKAEPLLMGVDIDAMMDPMKHIGLAVEQTERFIAEVVEPMRQHLGDGAGEETELRV